MAEDLPLENIPNQVGFAIINYDDGSVVKRSGQIQESQLKVLHRIVKDAVKSTLDDPFKRIMVQFDAKSFVLTTDGTLVFAVLVENK